MPTSFCALPQTTIRLQADPLLGFESLRILAHGQADHPSRNDGVPLDHRPRSLVELLDALARDGHGVILTMGKGGVGKTTVAAAIALELARRGLRVPLSTTEPAAHVVATVKALQPFPGLSIDRIDPALETARYAAEGMSRAGSDLDPSGETLLAEDLRSPCTAKIAFIPVFAQAFAQGHDRIVVLDTAPTGHTILLLDAALAYHREVTCQLLEMSPAVKQLLLRLHDPINARILLVTVPEATPVHEAAQRQRDLQLAQIEPYGWVINQSLTPLVIRDPSLKQRQQQESHFIREVLTQHALRTALIPWCPEPPVGERGLRDLLKPIASSFYFVNQE